jgi:hypothetical protein
MDRERQFIENLRDLENKLQPDDDAFAKREEKEARLAGRAAVRAWATGDEKLADQAFSFLVDMEDLPIVPLLEGPLRDDPKAVSQAMELITDSESELRKRVVFQLEKWLDDKRPVPLRPMPPGTEGHISERRVCDEAYVAMRKVIHFSDDEVRQLVDEDLLYDLPEPKRDAAIARARATKSWRIVLDPDSVDDDVPPSSKRPRPKRMLQE